MSDTIQLVQWTLGRRCPLRDSEESVVSPSKARAAVASARAFSRARRRAKSSTGIFGDVFVSRCTLASRPGSRKPYLSLSYPVSGFLISREFERLGGPDALREMCSNCPANIHPQEIAACVGSVFQEPDSPETEAQLKGIISRMSLQEDMASCFPATTLIWYSLWAESPVPAASLPVLRVLLSEMLKENSLEIENKGWFYKEKLQEFSSLISAIDRAENRNLDLYVELQPLGHVDLGMYAVFPHCPYCKAAAQVERWKWRKYPTEPHTCHVCATRFSPADTASSGQMEEFPRENLREILGDQAFRDFAKEYLIALGETPDAAICNVEETEKKEIERRRKLEINKELGRRSQRFLQEYVFVGLECLPPPSNFPEEKDTTASTDSSGWFNSENFAVVLRRCGKFGIKVIMMIHDSSDGEKDRFEVRKLKRPLAILKKWKSEGCDEKFYAVCIVPNSLVK